MLILLLPILMPRLSQIVRLIAVFKLALSLQKVLVQALTPKWDVPLLKKRWQRLLIKFKARIWRL